MKGINYSEHKSRINKEMRTGKKLFVLSIVLFLVLIISNAIWTIRFLNDHRHTAENSQQKTISCTDAFISYSTSSEKILF